MSSCKAHVMSYSGPQVGGVDACMFCIAYSSCSLKTFESR